MVKVGVAVLALIFLLVVFRAEGKPVIGTIRNTGDGWRLIADREHFSTGIASVSQTSEAIVLHYDFTASRVGQLTVSTDETYSSQRLQCGASVGLKTAVIHCFKESGIKIDPSTLTEPLGNLWIRGDLR